MNKKVETFREFIATQSMQLSVVDFIINILLTAFLAFILYKIYVKFGKSLSNRNSFGANFILIAVTTMIIITIVKSSLALSLGLVGALSIVRFRAAIKEPEELSYIFLTIALGLGFGADQRIVTIIGFVLLVLIIIFFDKTKKKTDYQTVNLIVSVNNGSDDVLAKLVDIISIDTLVVNLKRFERNSEMLEATFYIEVKDFNMLNKMHNNILEEYPNAGISFIDNSGIF